MRRRPIGLTAALLLGLVNGSGGAISPATAQSQASPLEISVVYVTKEKKERRPLALVDAIVTDKGLLGARAAMKDNNTTGQFLNQTYRLIELLVPEEGDLAEAAQEQLALGYRLFIADLEAEDLLTLADLPSAADAVILNVRAQDDALRNQLCRPNLFHVMPSYAMKADALAQYFAWKKWTKWFLVRGVGETDLAYADALRRAAKKFGIKIVEERVFEEAATSARTDSGAAQIQRQMPVFTQGAKEYDILMVADASDIFGEYLPYRTWDPRPVAGTQGLIAAAWHRSHEQWGGTQMQRRFKNFSGRDMTERDYTAWLAGRTLGEAITRIASADAATIKSFLQGEKFKVAAFKGQGLTFRAWNQQMRQPILLAAPRSLVSVSPQKGFLHQRSLLDTLGFDKPESTCQLG